MLAFIGFRLADLVVRLLPLGLVRDLARRTARLVFALHVPARARTLANFRRVMGERPLAELEACSRNAFEHFALSLVDFLRLARLRPAEVSGEVEVRGLRHLEQARNSGRGVIVLSVHSGNWEWGAAFLNAQGARIHVAARAHGGSSLERWFAARRSAHGITRIAESPLWPAAARALRRREWVAVMGDRVPPGERDSVCAWAAAVARRTGAVILPALMLRRAGGGYAACFEAPLSPHDCLAGGFRTAMRRHLEAEPGQWLAFDPLPEGLA
jgi:KDO2-lipid IV(A) lauroyltransferase